MQYAYYDHLQTEPQKVIGWFDTELINYGDNLPAAADLLEVTTEQWDARMDKLWAVQGGTLVPWVPPVAPPTLAEQAYALQNGPVTVTSVSNPELEGEYPNSALVRQAMTGVVSQINAGLGLPGGGVTFNWPSTDQTAKQWPEDKFVAFANQLNSFVYHCQQVVGGYDQNLPSNILDIDVVTMRRR